MQDELRNQLEAHGLGRVADALLSVAQPTIRFTSQRTDEAALEVGASKLGGLPDLPPDVPWPEQNGRPLPFIAQFRMTDVAPHDVDRALPASGLLSFFYDDEDQEGDEEPHAKVLYVAGDTLTLERRRAPSGLSAVQSYYSCALTFTTKGTLPDPDSSHVKSSLTSEEWSAYFDVLSYPIPDHRLLGYPFNLDSNVLMNCYVSQPHPPSSFLVGLSPQVLSELLTGRGDPRLLAQLEREAAGCRLLLQVASDKEAVMDWSGGGKLYFCIRQEALQARDFSKVYSEVQFM